MWVCIIKSPEPFAAELDKTKSQKSKKYALNLVLCKSKCTHVQIGKIVDQKEIFNDYYYMPSISKTLTDHLQSIPKDINQRFKIKKDSFIVDIGSNDGTFLESAANYSKKILGVDPAKNLSDIITVVVDHSSQNGIYVQAGKESLSILIKKKLLDEINPGA